MENNEIKKAKEVLEKISQDEREERLAELREKYRMDQHAIMLAGYDKGLKEGIKSYKKNIVKKLLKMNLPINQIMEITELTNEEIEKIKNEI